MTIPLTEPHANPSQTSFIRNPATGWDHLQIMEQSQSTEPPSQGKRLLFLDALRGFVMFWVIGGDTLSDPLATTPVVRATILFQLICGMFPFSLRGFRQAA